MNKLKMADQKEVYHEKDVYWLECVWSDRKQRKLRGLRNHLVLLSFDRFESFCNNLDNQLSFILRSNMFFKKTI